MSYNGTACRFIGMMLSSRPPSNAYYCTRLIGPFMHRPIYLICQLMSLYKIVEIKLKTFYF